MGRSSGKNKVSKVDAKSRTILLGEGAAHKVQYSHALIGNVQLQEDVLSERLQNSSTKGKARMLGLSEEEIDEIFLEIESSLRPLLTETPVDDQLLKINQFFSEKVADAFNEISQRKNIKKNFAFLSILDLNTNYKNLFDNFDRYSKAEDDYEKMIAEIEKNLKLINFLPSSNKKKNTIIPRRSAIRSLSLLLDLDMHRGRSWKIGHYAFHPDDPYEKSSHAFINEDGTISFNNTQLKINFSTIGIIEIRNGKIELIERRKDNCRQLSYKSLNKFSYNKDSGDRDSFGFELNVVDSGDGLTFEFQADFDDSPSFKGSGKISKNDLEEFAHSQETWALFQINQLVDEAVQMNRKL